MSTVIVPDRQAGRDALGKAAEVSAHALQDRLERRLKPGPMMSGVDPDAFGVVMVDGDEDRDPGRCAVVLTQVVLDCGLDGLRRS